LDVVGDYKRAALYWTQAEMSCLWIKFMDIFHEAC